MIYTLAIFILCVVCGALAFHFSASQAERGRVPLPLLVRCGLGICVFFGFWGSINYAAWRMGVPLDIGTAKAGKMAGTWWIGPAGFGFVALSLIGLHLRSKND